jgi:hypothetical protein
MKTNILPPDRDVEMLKKRRIWYILALVLFVLSLLLQQPLLFLASLFILLIGLVPDLWYRQGLRHLLVLQHVDQRHLCFGEDVVLSVVIENQKVLPLPWLDVENKITPPLALLSKRVRRLQKTEQDTLMSTWLLWSFQRVTRRAYLWTNQITLQRSLRLARD